MLPTTCRNFAHGIHPVTMSLMFGVSSQSSAIAWFFSETYSSVGTRSVAASDAADAAPVSPFLRRRQAPNRPSRRAPPFHAGRAGGIGSERS